ncbi:MAG: hypothetical protein JKP90_06715 [Desulfofustis sp. PB-SRB1]|nr:hypothetical protein [Desulfofustis sp. PB-SRB1]
MLRSSPSTISITRRTAHRYDDGATSAVYSYDDLQRRTSETIDYGPSASAIRTATMPTIRNRAIPTRPAAPAP